ncbi:histone family protein [Candidatus Woesearchaeota archaeon]|nr:histone family protein [Candidatus Woesearchaeota archaeon]
MKKQTRNRTLIPRAPLGRILMDVGAKRVSQDAMDVFSELLEGIAMEIGTKAMTMARHAGRKTVQAEDVKLAAR